MENGIIADIEVLEEEYIPDSLPCRDAQRKELVYCLSSLKNGIGPHDCMCYGQPGTGKTALVKSVLRQLKENTSTIAFFVNCWENKTLNLVLDRLVEQAGLVLSEVGYASKVARLKQWIKDRRCAVALDEVDRLQRKEINDILYTLKALGKTVIICISNSRKYVLDFDSRILSRMCFSSIDFPVYLNEELLAVLKHRIVDCRALYPDSYSAQILDKVADLAAGDARIAIQTLRNAAFKAEKKNRSKISNQDIEEGYNLVKNLKKRYYLEKLSPHHKLLVEILREKGDISSSRLYDLYRQETKMRKLIPKSRRSFNYYIDNLVS